MMSEIKTKAIIKRYSGKKDSLDVVLTFERTTDLLAIVGNNCGDVITVGLQELDSPLDTEEN